MSSEQLSLLSSQERQSLCKHSCRRFVERGAIEQSFLLRPLDLFDHVRWDTESLQSFQMSFFGLRCGHTEDSLWYLYPVTSCTILEKL